MLVLSRKEGQSICIGDQIVVKVSQLRGNRVKIAIEAPTEVSIRRSELADGGTRSQSLESASSLIQMAS